MSGSLSLDYFYAEEEMDNEKLTIVIASGKGGTGKTTLSLGLANYISQTGKDVTLLDCDVEEPNDNLFLLATITSTEPVYRTVPKVDNELCTGCGACAGICAFNCIAMVKEKPMIFPDLCHSCGGCMEVCPVNAVSEVPLEMGIVEKGHTDSLSYAGGRLLIGQAMSPPLIKAVKNVVSDMEVCIIDSPPGTSCPAIEAVKGADFVVLVTEPTPFGLNDLVLAVEMVRTIGIPFGVVINRAGSGDDRVERYCEQEGIDLCGMIPDSREIAEAYARGDFVHLFLNMFRKELDGILKSALRGKEKRK